MEDPKEKESRKDESAEAAIKRGKEAIEADEKLNHPGADKAQVKKDQEKDAEKWRNEG